MSYAHYQHNPGWGTSQFQFIPPPVPNFQPQPTWGGYDFYRAHAANPDPSLFDHALSYVRRHRDDEGGLGVGIYDARQYHHRAYGMGALNQMLPAEIGHAAAYEAYRTWVHNSSIYEPLSGDPERQREGLIGLAIAEATRLMQHLGRSLDSYGRMTASDAAAATASIIFFESRDDHYQSRSRSRRNSMSGSYGNPYMYDDPLMFQRHSRHRSHSGHSRHRSHSHSSHPIMYPDAQYGSSSIPIPGTNVMVPTHYGGGYMPSSYPSAPISMPSYGHAPPPHYGSSSMLAVPVASSSYGRHRSTSMSMPMAYSASAGVPYSASAGVPIVISTGGGRKHKHRHSHSSSKRSRSSDPTLRLEYPGYSRSGY